MDHTVYCYYKMDKPFLRLAPIKVEILRFDPLVVLFKQIISDYEIEVIKELSIPRVCSFNRSILFRYICVNLVVFFFQTIVFLKESFTLMLVSASSRYRSKCKNG